MLKIRKMLPGETRTYNDASYVTTADGETTLHSHRDKTSPFVALVVAGGILVEGQSPCRVHYSKPKRR